MELAERSGLSRQQIGRVLSGRSQGRLPMVLRLVHAMTGRVSDLVGALVDVELVPAVASEAAARKALSRLAFAHPWSPAARAWLGASGGVNVEAAEPTMAASLGMSEPEAGVLIQALISAGAARTEGGRLLAAEPATVEVRATPRDMERLRAHWARVSSERVAAQPQAGLFSFNVFAVSRADLARIKEAQRAFYREVRAIVSASEPEVAALLTVHTTEWAPPKIEQ